MGIKQGTPKTKVTQTKISPVGQAKTSQLRKPTAEEIKELKDLRREGKSIRAIKNVTGLPLQTVRYYIQLFDVENQHNDLVLEDPEVKKAVGQVGNITDLKDMVKDIIGGTLHLYKERIGDGMAMSPSDLSALMNIYTQLDKIKRLDDGSATDILDLELLSLQQIKEMVAGGTIDQFRKDPLAEKPQDVVIDATIKQLEAAPDDEQANIKVID